MSYSRIDLIVGSFSFVARLFLNSLKASPYRLLVPVNSRSCGLRFFRVM